MRLSQSTSIVKRREDQNLGDKVKGKAKHKRLDAICEKVYTRNHGGVKKVELGEFNGGRDEVELRRSSRARRAPVVLDLSPGPAKKRRKVGKEIRLNSGDRVKREGGEECETPSSSLRDLGDESSGWRARLRSRERSVRFGARESPEPSTGGKRKLFEDFDGFKGGRKSRYDGKSEGLTGGKSTVVRSKRPGRVEASNVLANENQDINLEDDVDDDKVKLEARNEVNLGDGAEDDKEKENNDDILDVRDEVNLGDDVEDNKEKNADMLGVRDEGDEMPPNSELEQRENDPAKDDYSASPHLCGNRESDVPTQEQSEEHQGNGGEKCRDTAAGNQSHGSVEDKSNTKKFGSADRAKDMGHPTKSMKDDTHKKLNGADLDVTDCQPRIKQGRRCGLCGGGLDGKPPKILVQDGACSENEAYSGSSASEGPNYVLWDGFGDESGWLGKLLGPVNDRFGIAGIWVHQQCAVWSPEVYFAGLGRLKNVRAALCRGRVLKCSRCGRPGATLGCRVDRCPKTYHLPCARATGCIFDHRKFLIACSDHRHLFQPHGIQFQHYVKKVKLKKMKLELRKMSNDASRKDIEAEEKWLENCGEDEEFLKRENKRLQRDLCRIAPTYIGGANSEKEAQYPGWESVAGLQDVIRCMKEVVILPLLYPEFFGNLGLTPPRGVLLHGYPGTGKTLVVRALVGACSRGDKRIAYFARKGADCLGKYVGDAERQLRLLFQVAEKCQPSIIFFDEIDGLAPCRGKQQDQTHSSVVSTLLALMDGLKSRGSVVVIGATNRPNAVDPALRRPGRFDREIYFPLPSLTDREAILSVHTQKWPKPISGSVRKKIARETVGFAGADLQALCTQAAIVALRRRFPLQEVLSLAGAQSPCGNPPPIPSFTVEERDWLEALSHAPPPCSRREAGIAANDVVSSPLPTHLIPCLLQPLTRLLISLYLDECVWLPLPLNKAAMLVKKVVVSVLESKRVQSDNWWSHVEDMLRQPDVAYEIEKNLVLANVLIGDSNFCGSDVLSDGTDEDCLRFPYLNFQHKNAAHGVMENIASGVRSGYQMLISGNPRSGQRHLASCLLHCLIGNVDVWKLDLGSISQEGHGDLVHGLTQILAKCAGVPSCLYMPRIDLWAVETFNQPCEEGALSASVELLSSESSHCGHHEVDKEHDLCPNARETDVAELQTDLKKVWYLWNMFVEQVESVRTKTSLIILATSELPLSSFPHRIRQFFQSEKMNKLEHKVPRFSVQLDGDFNVDTVVDSFALKLSKELSQEFILLIHGRIHLQVHSLEEKNSLKEKTGDMAEENADRACNNSHSVSVGVLGSKSNPVSPVALANKTVKGKSSLLLAISTLGYQILCYPQFAELCWVTSKLKDGPFANITGLWKGWPFNSCIVRPIDSPEQVAAASLPSSNIKSKEKFCIVRGLAAVGLSAYRGEYRSVKEVSSEIRKVLELIVGRINDKIKMGKDRNHFTDLLSQVAYLEDLVISWAYTLQSFEGDGHVPEAPLNETTVMLDAHNSSKDAPTEVEGLKINLPDGATHESNMVRGSPQANMGCAHTDKAFGAGQDACNEMAVTIENPGKDNSPPNGVNFESSEARSSPAKLSNGLKERHLDFQADDTCASDKEHHLQVSGNEFGIGVSCSAEGHKQDEVLPITESHLQPGDSSVNAAEDGVDNNRPQSTSYLPGSLIACSYQCCSECLVNLHNLLKVLGKFEWDRKGSYSTVEDVHDFVASLSSNLHLAVSRLSHDRSSICLQDRKSHDSKYRKFFECQEKRSTQCNCSGKGLLMECGCHPLSKDTRTGPFPQKSDRGLDLKFIIRDGILVSLDNGNDVSYHCKIEKLCLCNLIEWLVMSKEPFD